MVTQQGVLKALEAVIDPELGLNIVEMGLVYEVKVENDEVDVKMTLSARACPLHGSILNGAENVLKRMNDVRAVRVELVWDPPWTPDRIAPETRKRMGVR
ncbi:MAG: metal-sulfur cluster assembly factor [Deltaproteobacteria bacterium]|nr:metal-sulfur cluster assembly factor [Deltaproteobacteria bacterium]MCL5276697.1 metal-sulfur cluster assembly factor [Deltaproteobacteria bacterium]